MKETLSASHSILCTKSLKSYAERHYDFGELSECKFLQLGLNDTYLIRTKTEKFILRAYRLNWRTESDIAYELDALTHLADKGACVSKPLKRKDGKLFEVVVAPEGERFLVLFTFANGDPPNYEEQVEQQAYLYGKAAAHIHTHTDSFSTEHKRFDLSLATLIDKPLKEIQPLLSHRADDWEYMVGFASRLSAKIQNLLANQVLEHGFCHGDFHGGNAHHDMNGTVTFFDFDCCGHGWRAYDVATFFWGARIQEKHRQRCRHFLRGYVEGRHFSDESLASVPYFVAARHLWLIGLHTAISGHHGSGWLNDRYFDRQIKLLREMDTECFTKDVHEIYL